MSDKVDAAIAGAEQKMELVQGTFALQPDGRPCLVAIPKDFTDREVCHLIGSIIDWTNQMRQQRAASGIWTPGSEARPS